MLLISDGLYRILEPQVNKCFRIWTLVLCALGAVLLPVTRFHVFSILAIPIAILIVFFLLTSGYSQEYELRDRKIHFKKVVNIRSRNGPMIPDAPSRELEVYYIVSALYGFRFEQTAYEKKRNIGRIYFNGTTRVEADRPLTAYEKQVIPTPHSYAVYGVENFERIKTTLKEQLPPEKFVENKQETA